MTRVDEIFNKYDGQGKVLHLNGEGPHPKSADHSLFPPLLDAAAFMATFTNPDYIVDGIIQRGRVHALTSMTGHGKTAVALYAGCAVAMGRNIGSLEVIQGNVVFLAGENPDDLCGRFHAACQFYQINPAELPIRIMPGNFQLAAETSETLRQTIDKAGYETALIIGDSAAAYFPGDDDNQNVQMGEFARNLRVLTKCRGNPAVVALCHPIKAATKDNLLPRGGGAFLNEIDANLTLWSDAQGEVSTLHWQGKIRGADFSPLGLSLKQVKLDHLKDAKGRSFVSVVATIQTDEQAERATKQALNDENTVLELIRRHPGISLMNIATNAGWLNAKGDPAKAKVQKLLISLNRNKLAKPWRGKWKITDAGKKELSGEESDA